MRCRTVQRQLAAYLTGDLRVQTAERLRTHLSDCRVCARQHDEMRHAARLLSGSLGSLPEESLSGDRLEALERVESPERFRSAGARSRRLWMWCARLWPLSAVLTPMLVIGLPFIFIFLPWAERVYDGQMPGEPLPGITQAAFVSARFVRGPGLALVVAAILVCLAPWIGDWISRREGTERNPDSGNIAAATFRVTATWIHMVIAPVLLMVLCTALYLPRVRLVDRLGAGAPQTPSATSWDFMEAARPAFPAADGTVDQPGDALARRGPVFRNAAGEVGADLQPGTLEDALSAGGYGYVDGDAGFAGRTGVPGIAGVPGMGAGATLGSDAETKNDLFFGTPSSVSGQSSPGSRHLARRTELDRGEAPLRQMTERQQSRKTAAPETDVLGQETISEHAMRRRSGRAMLPSLEKKPREESVSESQPAHPPAAPMSAPAEPGFPAPSVYAPLPVNPFVLTADDALSTFALDTDTASYSLTRAHLLSGRLPPPAAIRTEEFINAFDYAYPSAGTRAFNMYVEGGPSPFGRGLTLLKIGVKARVIGRDGVGPRHLVFALDTSGSMAASDRLPLVKEALQALLEELSPHDRLSVVGFGRDASLLLSVARLDEEARDRFRQTVDGIQCGGATNLGRGVRAALEVALRSTPAGEKAVVVLCSDGMANLGATETRDLLRLATLARERGLRLHTVGFGLGNYNDNILEQLANRGDGTYVFVDSPARAREAFAREMSAHLNVVALDAKIQVAFNAASIRRYRLLGYENRDIADQDFRNDSVDAGEVGSGKSATALYEVELTAADAPSLGTVYVRYRDARNGQIEEIAADLERRFVRRRTPDDSPHFFLAAAVAEFAELLRRGEFAADGSYADIRRVLAPLTGVLRHEPAVHELWLLVQRAEQLSK